MENSEEHFSLKWGDFRSSLTEGFHDFLQEEMMVDVTLAAEGKLLQAHRLVLSICSPYFKNLFKVNPCQHPIVILKDVGHNELSKMLEFIYKGEVSVKHEDLPSFLKLAESLNVKGLAGENVKRERESFGEKGETPLNKVRKKKSKIMFSDFDKENTESEVIDSKQTEKRVLRGRKRRFSSKQETPAKIKKETHEKLMSVSVNCEDDDEDENPLVKLISDKNKSGESSKNSESKSDNKNSLSGCGEVDDNDPDGDDVDDDGGNGDDFNVSPSFFPPETTQEAEQIPQDAPACSPVLRFSPVWNYYEKIQNNIALCKICRKTLKGAQTTQAEYHLRAKHPDVASEFLRLKAEWLEKKKKVNEVFLPAVDTL